jgi:DNA repair exonuclease SbcCD ATPase subunit
MAILKVKFKNIFAYGNTMQEIDFDKLGNFTQVCGQNGVGKSSIIKIIKIGLYQEYDSIPVKEIANEINGNGFICVYYKKRDGSIWRIESNYGISSLNSLKVFKGDSESPENTGLIPETKKFIKENILEYPYQLFNNIVNPAIGQSKSFLELSADDCRKIRDRLFSFFVLNDMFTSVSKEISLIQQEIQKLEYEIDSNENLILSIKENIDDYIKNQKEEKKKKFEELTNELNQKEEYLKQLQTTDVSLKKEIKSLKVSILNYITVLKESELKNIILQLEELSKQKNDTTNEINIINESILNINKKFDKLSLIKEFKFFQDQLSKLEQLKSEESLKKESLSLLERSLQEKQSSLQEKKKLLELKLYYKKSKENKELLKQCNDELEQYKTALFNEEKLFSSINDLIKSYKNISQDLQKEISKNKSIVKAYENGICPTCYTELSSDSHKSHLVEIKDELETLEKTFVENAKLLESQEILLHDCGKRIEIIKQSIINSDYRIKDLTSGFTRIPEYDSLLNENFNIEDINDLEKEILHLEKDLIKLEKEDLYFVKSSLLNLDKEINSLEFFINNNKEKFSNFVEEPIDEESITNELNAIKSNLLPKKNHLDNIINKIIKLQSDKSALESFIQAKKSELGDYYNTNVDIANINSHNEDINSLKVKEELLKNNSELISNVTQRLLLIKEEINKINSDSIDSHLLSQEAKLKKLQEEKEAKLSLLENKKEYLINHLIFQKTISDAGIKSYIIKNYTPEINNNINSILLEQNINIRCKFNSEFKPILYRNHREISNISTGQKKMIDTAILISIMKLMITRYPGINFCFYDEVFSSLHSENINITLDLLKKYIVDIYKIKILVVNHSPISNSYFDNYINIKNTNGFSNLEIVNAKESV